jgi:hypothetical protein
MIPDLRILSVLLHFGHLLLGIAVVFYLSIANVCASDCDRNYEYDDSENVVKSLIVQYFQG